MARIMLAELPRSIPVSLPNPPATTQEAIQQLPRDSPGTMANVAERLCRDFGGAKDRQLWGAIHKLTGQVWRGEVAVDDVLDAYRQAMGPKAKNRGAVFTHALRAHGWSP